MPRLLGHLAALYVVRCAIKDARRARHWERFLTRLRYGPQRAILTLNYDGERFGVETWEPA